MDFDAPAIRHIPHLYLAKWQKLVDMLAELYGAEAALINRVDPDRLLRVQVASAGSGNPFAAEPDAILGADAYCASVLAGPGALAVHDAEQDAQWRPRLAANRQLRAYLGVPLQWPDKSSYGTLCVLSRGAADYPEAMRALLWQMKRLIESDFRALYFVRAVDRRKASLETLIQERTAELQQVNARLARELEQSRRLEEVLRELAVGGAGSYGEAYFHQLVEQLARLFGGEHAFVALVEPASPKQARMLACYSGGRWLEESSYALADMPCAEVLAGQSLVVAEGLAQRHPRAALLRRLAADSYLGVPLFDLRGQAIGVLAMLGKRRLPDSRLARELMELLAGRASTEIQRMRVEQHLRRMAHRDDLTGLPNRAQLLKRLERAIAQAQRERHVLAVLFIDLDNFKTINDTLGHEVGDALLIAVSLRLFGCLRDNDTIARLGGDEFAALMENIDALQVSAVCERIVAALSEPLYCRGHELFVSASIGISQYPGDGEDATGLLRAADAAMYRAKELGRNQFQYFAKDIKQALQRDLVLLTQLRRAILQQQLTVAYQPKVRTADRSLVGAEALVRWHDPTLGPIAPAEFIPLAERSGVIAGIGELVLGRVIGDLLRWRAAGLPVPPIAINVSPRQLLSGGFAGWLHAQLQQQGLGPDCLIIELTEGSLIERGAAGLKVLGELSAQGFSISIDDFGTGYSSLSYLKRMPISELKIDRSFVHGIADDGDDQAIASAILSLARTLGLTVVAEGVEDLRQLQALCSLGCSVAQGDFFHRPLEAAEFAALLEGAGLRAAG
ncbi:bifunctional diguanylate cyclase/phosphodiesterase [Roseateles violae]|uniref:EAL domain-containing protein n=1 Tax=Roseateles violae TaxID=3058042 RepID=A0ABT8DQI5_9BURK|nr:EAL domain-containing protein [Pelomonas sp. PFR6]MDN3920271.1 EAL domain-containing protein [Pelomonas sp. PFR6]